MQFQSYEDYMRSVLGYPKTNMYEDEYMYYQMGYNNYEMTNKIEELYPEIYVTINPMVKTAIDKYNLNNSTCTREILDKMTDEICSNIEAPEMGLNREADNNVRERAENRQNNRQNNRILRDLIKILIITNIINKKRPRQNPYYRLPYPRVGFNEF